MNAQTTWFQDEDLLLRELRRHQRAAGALPRIAGYAELQELRRGGQGVVYVARQVSTRQKVAIKVVLDGALASREVRRRFEREIELVATVRHPNIVRVYDSGETDDGRPYCIMEYIDGCGLDELLAGQPSGAGSNVENGDDHAARPRSLAGWLELFARICDGVQHAHQQGVIHRDLKPSNVRIDPQGEPHVLDFGLAKLAAGGPEATRMSRSGHFMGSLPWASPEQSEGLSQAVDVRSDVYSLGVMLYQVLAGRFPYRVDGTLRETLQNIQTAEPTPLRELRRGVSDELATIALKALAKEPARRYQSAGELARDIRRHLAGEPIEAKRDSAWYAVRKTLGRYKTTVRVGGVLLVASLVLSGAMIWLRARALAAEQLAASRAVELQSALTAEVEARRQLEAQVAKTRQVKEFLDSTLRAVDPWKHPGRDLGPLRELLDGAVQRLARAFPDQPEVEAAIAGTLGWDYRELGLFEQAEQLLSRSYELSRSARGDEHVDTLDALNNLARLMTERGKYEQATALYARLREASQRTLGPEHRYTLVARNNQALQLDWEGRASEAEVIYREVLAAQTRRFGEMDADRLSTLTNLAACLPALGQLDEAEQLSREIVQRRGELSGPHHPETLQARVNLAVLLHSRGRPGEAEPILREVLQQAETAFPAGHPMVSSTLQSLATVVGDLGRADESLALSRRAYESALTFSGRDHPDTLNRKNEYACALIALRRFDEALPLASELCDEYRSAFGRSDWRTLNAAGNLAFALNQSGDAVRAEAVWRGVIADADPSLEAGLGPLATARANLGGLLADQQRWSDAETELRAAIELQERLGQAEHWRTEFMRAGLGRVLSETGRLAEAEPLLRQAVARLAEALGSEHERTQRVQGYLQRLSELGLAATP